MDATLLHGVHPALIFWLQLFLPFLPLATRRPMVLVILVLGVIAMQALIVFWALSIVGAIGSTPSSPWPIVFGGIVALSIGMSICIAIGRIGGMVVGSRMASETQRHRAHAIGDFVGVATMPSVVLLSTQIG
ncbi:MAG: hypothetical protein AAF577_03295 [Pseudomonadota bacterium]